jgi:hypothetical protein
VKKARNDFLAGARFTGQEHRRLGLRHLGGFLQRVDPLGRLADDANVAGFRLELFDQRLHPRFEVLGAGVHLGHLTRRLGELLV